MSEVPAQTIEIGIAITHATTRETAGAICTAYLMGFVQAVQQFPDSAIEPTVARVARQYLPDDEQPVMASLEGLRTALLTQRAPEDCKRDEKGWLNHDAIPALDEGTNYKRFLEAFGLEVAFSSMESDRPEYFERWSEEGLDDCLEWEPSRPDGNGWILLEIYMGEEDCYALWVRDYYEAERERKEEQRASRRSVYEHNLQHALNADSAA